MEDTPGGAGQVVNIALDFEALQMPVCEVRCRPCNKRRQPSQKVVADETAAPFPTTFDDFNGAGHALDHMSVFDWIETRVVGGHATAFGQLLDAAYAIEFGADTTLQSALNLVYLLAFQPDPHTFEIFGESDERFHIRGGNQQLPQAMRLRYRLSFESTGTRWAITWSWRSRSPCYATSIRARQASTP